MLIDDQYMVEKELEGLKKHGQALADNIYLVRPEKRNYLTSNSLIFIGDQKLLVDAGFQHGTGYLKSLSKIIKPDLLIFSHYHIDHLMGCHLFPNSLKIIHGTEINHLKSLDDYIRFCYDGGNLPQEEKEFWDKRFQILLERESLVSWRDLSLNNIQPVKNNEIDLGGMCLQVIHLPGHSPGHCGLFEPERKLLFIGDIDISLKFGPWYGWYNTDLGLFRQSVIKLREFVEKTDIDTVVTSHSQPVDKKECLELLDRFYDIFEVRKKRILKYIGDNRNGVTMNDIADQLFIYRGKISDTAFVWKLFEKIHVEKHVDELAREELIEIDGFSIRTT